MREIIYDENLVPDYQLPDPLKMADGTPVADAETWHEQRRPELLALFESEVYGKTMPAPESIRFETVDEDRQAIEGKAIRKQVTITVGNKGKEHAIHLLMYLPADADGPVPAFIGMNFNGNHRIYPDPAIRLPEEWMREGEGVVEHRATEESRGLSADRWCVENTVKRGYGVATIYYGDLDADFDDGFQNGIHPLFYSKGQTRPADDEWAAIGAWAWGLSRGLDYLETDQDVNAGQVIVIGHSRLGKTALWA
ncbi:acetylxylan esterase, partial [Planctomycetota bacterium]